MDQYFHSCADAPPFLIADKIQTKWQSPGELDIFLSVLPELLLPSLDLKICSDLV